MSINKNTIIYGAILAAAIVAVFVYYPSLGKHEGGDETINLTPSESPESLITGSPSITQIPKKGLKSTAVTLPTGAAGSTYVDQNVPWNLLLADASCELKGEVKFLNHNTYDNQDALFIYKGIDNPGRNIFWSISPSDDIRVGPNIFSKMPLPNGESLLGVFLPDEPKYKKYEITAKIQYGRLVDENGKFSASSGTVKVFEKQCNGKTTVVLP